jgi:hypothetical protein
VDLWLDGRPLRRGPATDPTAEYDARSGSTVATIYSKTFQSLDNGPHTIAAEFMIQDSSGESDTRGIKVQEVAAQKFRLELTGSDAPPQGSGGSAGGTSPRTSEANAAAPDIDATWRNPFGDVRESDWFYADVVYVCENNLMNGTSETAFSPQAPMTRGMLLTVLGRFSGADADAYADGFADAAAGAYYTPYIAWAAENGIVSGVGGGAFAPDADVTRQDIATVVARYADFAGRTLPSLRARPAFADDALTADYARDALDMLVRGGILNGKPGNRFDPAGRATRAEVAAILHRFIEATK